jgi:hypothetical protein
MKGLAILWNPDEALLDPFRLKYATDNDLFNNPL